MRSLSKKATQGFSLIELLIVITIVGILAAVGLSNYEAYAIKVRIAEAHRFALALTVEADGFYEENGRFEGLNGTERAIKPIPGSESMRGYNFWTNSNPRNGTDGVTYAPGQIGTVQIYFNAELYPGSSNSVRLSFDYLPDEFGNGEWLCVQHFIASLRMDEEYQPDDCKNEMRFR